MRRLVRRTRHIPFVPIPAIVGISPADVAHAQPLGTTTLVLVPRLQPAGTAHGHPLDVGSLTQHGVFSPSRLSHLQYISPFATLAAVQLFDGSGQPAGWGPSNDPLGVKFVGATPDQFDTWVPIPIPGVAFSMPAPGGTFVADGPPGNYLMTWLMDDVSALLVKSGTHAFTIP